MCSFGALRSSYELADDYEIVMKAVLQSPEALQFASTKLRGNREIVFAAVAQNWKTVGGQMGEV